MRFVELFREYLMRIDLNCTDITFTGQLIQAIIQIILWNQIYQHLTSYIKRNYSNSAWYKQAICKGEGEQEFLRMICCIPNHSISALFIWLSMQFNSPYLFCVGTLTEFADEFVDIYQIVMDKWYYKTCTLSNQFVFGHIIHHIPGVLFIIPINIYFSDNIYIQNIAYSLLTFFTLVGIFAILYKTRDIYDLQQRGQFTVYFFCVLLIMVYSRFYLTTIYFIQFLYHQYMELTFFMRFIFIFYAIFITVFDVVGIGIFAERLYQYLYGNKGIKKQNEDRTMASIRKTRSESFIRYQNKRKMN